MLRTALFLLLFSSVAIADLSDRPQDFGASLEPPSQFDPFTHKKHIEFFKRNINPPSMSKVPTASRKMTEDEGRQFYFEGMLPLVLNANNPAPSASEFEAAIREGRVVDPPCATTNSQVLKRASLKAKLPIMANLFSNPHHYYPTHNNEVQLQKLGWFYYLKSEYVSPIGSVGTWSRYTFDKIPGHTGHIFIIFKDGGNGPDLVGDNTRRSGEDHGHPYRMPGQTVGFWLPPGVYPMEKRFVSDWWWE